MKHDRRVGRTTWMAVLMGVVLGAAAIAASPTPASADGACGSKENPCPLQKWMRANMGAALAANDTAGLAKALETIAAASPDPGWNADATNGWSALAKAGAAAAKKGDIPGAKASCKGCHNGFKDKYKAQYRNRPAPN